MTYSKPLNELEKPDWMSEAEWKATLESVQSLNRIKSDAKAHLEAYVSSNGEVGYETPAGFFLILTTIGRKSGERKSTPLSFMQEGENFYVVGSLAGSATDPQWAQNLEANPQAWVQVKDKKWEASVQKLGAEERKAIWPRVLKVLPQWGVFQKRTDREFPVFRLTQKK